MRFPNYYSPIVWRPAKWILPLRTNFGAKSSLLMIDVVQMFDGFLASFVFQCNKYNILGKKAYEMKYI